jgi:hypothetical protein
MANPALTQGLPRTYSAAEKWLLENPKFLEQMRNAGASPYNRIGGGFSVAENGALPPLRAGLADVGATAASRAMPIAAGMAIPTPTALDPAEGIQSKIDAQGAVLGGPKISNDELNAIIAEAQKGPSAAPPLEMYDAIDRGAGGMPAQPMMKKASYGGAPQSGYSAQKPQRMGGMGVTSDEVAAAVQAAKGGAPKQDYTQASPAFQQAMKAYGSQVDPIELDPQDLIDEMTRQAGNPTVYRGGLPTRMKKNPGMRMR